MTQLKNTACFYICIYLCNHYLNQTVKHFKILLWYLFLNFQLITSVVWYRGLKQGFSNFNEQVNCLGV